MKAKHMKNIFYTQAEDTPDATVRIANRIRKECEKQFFPGCLFDDEPMNNMPENMANFRITIEKVGEAE